jgi:hypothetical protein
MNRGRRMKRLSLIAWALALAGCFPGAEPRAASSPPRRPPPYLHLHGFFGDKPAPTPSYIKDHWEFLDSRPFDGLAVYLRKPDLSSECFLGRLQRPVGDRRHDERSARATLQESRSRI